VARRSLATLEDRGSIPGAGKNNVLVTKSDWPTLVSSVCYASLVSAPLIETLSRDLNYGATIQPDPSREINITRVSTTSQFISTMAAYVASFFSKKLERTQRSPYKIYRLVRIQLNKKTAVFIIIF